MTLAEFEEVLSRRYRLFAEQLQRIDLLRSLLLATGKPCNILLARHGIIHSEYTEEVCAIFIPYIQAFASKFRNLVPVQVDFAARGHNVA